MLVKQILKLKESQAGDVVTVAPDQSVAEAAAILSEKRIGSLVVSADGVTVEGILSERDIVRELGSRGSGCLQDLVRDMMTADIVTCAPTDQDDAVLARMTEGRFRHMPVMRDGRMLGVISIGDVVKARLSELSMEKQALEGLISGH